jgi:membrane protease YdiL (CAAX protease family)
MVIACAPATASARVKARSLPVVPSPGVERARSAVSLIAPRWHTAALIGLILAVAVTGTVLTRLGAPVRAPSDARVAATYVPMLVVNGALLFYVGRFGRSRNVLQALLGRGWNSVSRACTDVALALAAWLSIEGVEAARSVWRNGAPPDILPHTVAERTMWVVVAAVVGFSEEVVYRGYLQVQLTAFTRRVGVAVVLQGALFGVAHCEQGPGIALRFGVYGVLLGGLARWRRSLWPGILCHVALDILGGLVLRAP